MTRRSAKPLARGAGRITGGVDNRRASDGIAQTDDEEKETGAFSLVGLKIGAVMDDGWYPSEDPFIEETDARVYGLDALWLNADESGGFGIAVNIDSVSYKSQTQSFNRDGDQLSSEVTQFTVGAALVYGLIVDSTAVYGGIGYATTETTGEVGGLPGGNIGESDHWYGTAGAIRGSSKGVAYGISTSYFGGGIETVTLSLVEGYRF